MKRMLLFYSVALFTFSCKKNKTYSELDKLPPLTQEGKNTIGFLVNGQAWMPQGHEFQPNFFIIVDPSFQNGSFDLRTYRLINNKKEELSINTNDLRATGIYNLGMQGNIFVDFTSDIINCNFLFSNSNYKSGFLKINRYDLQAGIVSGEFELKLYDSKISCDTIRITNGRFDYKL